MEKVVLVNGRFVDVVRGKLLPDGSSVILADGKIKAVLAEGEPLPEDARKVDLGGRSVFPGLINPHVHVQLKLPTLLAGRSDLKLAQKLGRAQIDRNMADCVERGITVIGDAVTENLKHNRLLNDRITSGEIPGPRIVQCVLVGPLGGAFSPRRGLKLRMVYSLGGMTLLKYENPLCGVIPFDPAGDEAAARSAVDRAIDERGAEVIKFYDQREFSLSFKSGAAMMDQKQLNAAVDQARSRGIATTIHHVTCESFHRGLEAGVTSLAHLPYDAPLSDQDIMLFIRSKAVLVPTLSLAFHFSYNIEGFASSGLKRTDLLQQIRDSITGKLAGEFWLEELGGPFAEGLKKAKEGRFKLLGLIDLKNVYQYYAGVIAHGVDNAALLFEAGGTLACANDAGAVPLTPAMMGLENLLLSAFINRAGGKRKLGGAELLRASTLGGAKALGLEGTYGTIEAGKAADLAVTSG
ncbi:MAG: amidohydrolase family protein, partial [Myxococcota bacterium]